MNASSLRLLGLSEILRSSRSRADLHDNPSIQPEGAFLAMALQLHVSRGANSWLCSEQMVSTS